MKITSGPLRDGIAIHLPELADRLRMSKRQTRTALSGLIERGFIVNLTPELSLDRSVFRLTMFPFQGTAPTDDYLTPDERSRLRVGRRQ
jgi:hypothetical protein